MDDLTPACRALLALGDEPAPPRPRVLRGLGAVLAALVLAAAAPLAWASAGPDKVVATATKAPAAEEAPDEDEGEGPSPDPPRDLATEGKTASDGDRWPATAA